MSTLDQIRERAEQMLDRWGREMVEGEGRPNILALADRVCGGNGEYVSAGPMFSPDAERADRLLREIMPLDRGVAEYLIAYSMGLSSNDMARNFKISQTTALKNLETALATFTMAVYYHRKSA